MVEQVISGYPNVIIAGAPKCGTSSLFFWLAAHPQVCASKVKETYFLAESVNRFNKNLNIHDQGLEAYQEHFRHCGIEKLRIEATPVYIYHERSIEFVKMLPETPKIIFVLRKPADRIYSHWRFNRYRMKNIRMSFEEYIDEENIPPNWSNYLENTHYINYIHTWISGLGKKNILVYQFEQILQDRAAFMKSLASDLDIDPDFYDSFDFFHRNETVAVKNKRLHRWGLKLEPLVPRLMQERLIPLYLNLNAKKAPRISEKDQLLKEKLNERFTESNRKLKEAFPTIDLSLWGTGN